MNRIASLSAVERRGLFTEAGAMLGLAPFYMEKDFWVCWVLEALFGDPKAGPHLTFRGGTSLSKGWQCIERFSEDIDLAISRDWLAPDGRADLTAEKLSTSQREKRLSELRSHCRKAVTDVFCPLLQERLGQAMGTSSEAWSVEVEPLEKAKDPFKIWVHYPQSGLALPAARNKQFVEMELSGRADGWPMEERMIRPYLAEALRPFADLTGRSLSCVRPERTFWEKAALVHEHNTRKEEKSLPQGQSRHLYDLHRLWTHLRVAEAPGFAGLFPDVKEHRRAYFAYHWVDYDALIPGTLQVVPTKEKLPEWKIDYDAMQPMFFGKPPSFDEVLQTLRQIEEGWK